MGKVFLKLKVMPTDLDVDLNSVKDKILRLNFKDVEIRDIAVKPIAFGLKALLVLAIMPDTEGVSDRFMEEIGKIKGVESVEVEDMELL
ncbi:MAG: elongation factor 1-beta [Archaeoglobales archaeon]|jgi:elongation factor 1-beta|nr:elongation factor 1-beta [Archaeoglobi archaeon]NHW23572.1 elongation factor 1-beta [Archaeoglobales archaeon]TDA30299.1 MAG: elongation factor 1-beta [Archaeoglobi archaeon]